MVYNNKKKHWTYIVPFKVPKYFTLHYLFISIVCDGKLLLLPQTDRSIGLSNHIHSLSH